MTTNNTLHENENYKVITTKENDTLLYALVNKHTGVIERTDKIFPQILSDAEQFNCYVQYQQWKWHRVNAEKYPVGGDEEAANDSEPDLSEFLH